MDAVYSIFTLQAGEGGPEGTCGWTDYSYEIRLWHVAELLLWLLYYCCDQISWKKKFRGERNYFSLKFQVPGIIWGGQGSRDWSSWHISSPFHSSTLPGARTRGWCCLHLEWVLPHEFTQVRRPRAGAMAHQLKSLAVLTKDLSSVLPPIWWLKNIYN